MPKKYHVSVKEAPPRFSPISKYASFEITRCYGCRRCVKYTACVYGVYRKKSFDPLQMQDTGDNMCINCMRCVQECKNNIFSRSLNPRWERLGDDYWTPDIIDRVWKQAGTGKIPVSGAGYRGPFCGPGFDRMWTDMSEIVRPTRDGIHGREYISTLVELGRKPGRLSFDEKGNLAQDPPPLCAISFPAVIDAPPDPQSRHLGESARRAMAIAAGKLGSLAVATAAEAGGALSDLKDRLIVRFDPARDDAADLAGARMAELLYSDGVLDEAAKIKEAHPGMVVSIRLELDEKAADRASALASGGADVIHLHATPKGKGFGEKEEEFVIDMTREIHLRLVEDNARGSVSLILTGGIALAEHLAKIIICGVDAAAVELAPIVALECRMCVDCEEQAECPVTLGEMDENWGAQRIVNLLGSWHSQLIEVMGAMGLREVRRLRGEVGRAMFFKDLENESFAPIFGKRDHYDPPSGNPGWDAKTRQESKKEPPAPEPPAIEAWKYKGAEAFASFCRSRYRNYLAKYRVVVNDKCTECGKCVEACKYEALVFEAGRLLRPKEHLCRGASTCRELGSLCVDACPESAIWVGENPLWKTFGDPRWTADLISATWLQAETGLPPKDSGLEYKVGQSGGGFDRIDLVFPEGSSGPGFKPEDVDLEIPLNRRGDDGRPEVSIGFPVYGGGMSFGSISLATMVSRARAWKAFNSFTCTGEGGYPDALKHYDDNVITQVATGLFGVREDTIQRVKIVEFKYAQGAKPGLGGHLLGDKVTPAVAKMREAVEGSALFSPFPFHSVYSVEDHKKHVDWIKHVNPKALVSVKVSTPTDVDMVAVGSYYAGAHIIHIDGSYGGTGAAPDIAKKNIAMPIEYAIPKVHNFLVEEGIRDKMTLIASGGIRTAWDLAKAIALGADGAVIGTAEMVALECIRCGNCESGRGCPRGIATTDSELSLAYDSVWGSQRLINLFHSWCLQLQEILWRLGMKSVKELVGRTDLLTHLDYAEKSA